MTHQNCPRYVVDGSLLVPEPRANCNLHTQAEAQCNGAKEVYEQINGQLISELPKLNDIKVPYLDPSFEALVRCQLRYAREAREQLDNLDQYFEHSTGEGFANVADQSCDARINQILENMKDLSICGMA